MQFIKSSSIKSSSLVLALLVSFAFAPPATAGEFRLSGDNDLLGNNPRSDDYYTFGLRAEWVTETWTVRLDENAFTDLRADRRFDETYLIVGRAAPREWLGRWSLWTELGVVHVGEGLLGQSAQNEVHDLIGDERVHATYLDLDDYHPHVGLELGRQYRLGDEWTLGPQVNLRSSFDFKSSTLVGARTHWRPGGGWEIDVLVGAKTARSELPLLDVQLEDTSEAALVEVNTPWNVYFEWSDNRYGTGRQHFALGIRLGASPDGRRDGAWAEGFDTMRAMP